jgi:hypothetical protein
MSDRAPGIGHNLPSAVDRADPLLANANRWRAERPEIDSEDIAKVGDDFIAQLRTLAADLEAEQDRETEPHEHEITAIKLRYRDVRAKVKLALDGMLAMASRWLVKKRDLDAAAAAEKKRIADEKIAEAVRLDEEANKAGASVEAQLAAQRAHEAAENSIRAAVAPPKRPRMKGDYSPRALGLVPRWHAEVDDVRLAFRHYGKIDQRLQADVEEAVKAAANRDARAKKREDAAPAGVRFVKRETAQ